MHPATQRLYAATLAGADTVRGQLVGYGLQRASGSALAHETGDHLGRGEP